MNYYEVFVDGNLNKSLDLRKTLFLQWLYHRTLRGYSPLILVVGAQRSGKTAMALRMAYEISIMRNIPFNLKEDMFYSISDFAMKYKRENRKIYVIDEAGISLGKYEHWAEEQHVYDKIINTQAYKNNILFIVLPFATDISKQHIKHIDMILDVWDRGKYRLKKPFRWHADLSFKPPRCSELEVIAGVPLPPPYIWDEYLTHTQKNYKSEILDKEIEKLEKKRLTDAAKFRKLNRPPSPMILKPHNAPLLIPLAA